MDQKVDRCQQAVGIALNPVLGIPASILDVALRLLLTIARAPAFDGADG
jgi:hypothetical protein